MYPLTNTRVLLHFSYLLWLLGPGRAVFDKSKAQQLNTLHSRSIPVVNRCA